MVTTGLLLGTTDRQKNERKKKKTLKLPFFSVIHYQNIVEIYNDILGLKRDEETYS